METLKIVLITNSGSAAGSMKLVCLWIGPSAVHGVQKMCHFFWRGKGRQYMDQVKKMYTVSRKLKIGYGCGKWS